MWRTAAVCAVGAFLIVFAWEVAPRVVQHWSRLGREVSERRAFAATEMADLAGRYPTFMGRVAEETVNVIARGSLWPALEHAWDTNSLVCTARAVSAWCASNIFVRLLSPQSTWEYVAIVFLLITVLYVFANLTASAIVSSSVRHKQTLKYGGGGSRVEMVAE